MSNLLVAIKRLAGMGAPDERLVFRFEEASSRRIKAMAEFTGDSEVTVLRKALNMYLSHITRETLRKRGLGE
jgi:hypothetical protein